jgi:hypothetical protein
MRAWHVLMATFITLMIVMVILLGGPGDIQGNHWAMPFHRNSAYGVQEVSRTETSVYPWQLDYVTLGTKVGMDKKGDRFIFQPWLIGSETIISKIPKSYSR